LARAVAKARIARLANGSTQRQVRSRDAIPASPPHRQ
jgi:hypothetical protein